MDGGDLGTEPHGDPRSQCGVARSRADTDDSEAPHHHPWVIHRGSFLYFSIPGQKGLDLLRAVGGTTRKRALTTREGQYKENTCVQHSRGPAIQGAVTALDLHLTSEKFV